MREMSMLYTKDMSLNNVRIQDEMRRADRARLVREALAGRRGSVRFYAPLMVSLGKRLIAFGASLQSRYAHTLREREAGEMVRTTGEYALSRRG